MRSIGEFLKGKRIEKGFSEPYFPGNRVLNQRVIRALEDDNFAFFKGYFYYINFLKDYISELGLNVDYIIDEYKQELGEIRNVNFKSGIYFPGVRYSKFKNKNMLFKVILTLIVLSIVFFFLYKKTAIYKMFDSGKTVTSSMIPPTFLKASLEKFFNVDFSPVNLTLKFSDRCWVRLMRGDTIVVEKVFQKGEGYLASGYNISVLLGNPSVVDIELNGLPVKDFKERVGFVKITLNPETIERYIK